MTFDGKRARLEVVCPSLDDEGEYSCKAVNTVGEASTSAALMVEGKWQNVSPPKAKPPKSGDLYDVITLCGVASGNTYVFDLRSVSALGVPHSVRTSYRLPDIGCFAFISHCFNYQVDTKLFISLL